MTMKTLSVAATFAVILLVFATRAFADEPVVDENTTLEVQETEIFEIGESDTRATTKDSSADREPIDGGYYKEKLEITKEYHETLVDTVYFSIGTILVITIAVIVGVLAFVWFAFNRNFDREKESLQSQIRAELDSDVQNLKDGLRTNIEEMKEDILAIRAEAKTSIIDSNQNIRRDLDEAKKESLVIAKKESQKTMKGLKETREEIKERIDVIEFDIAEIELRQWRSRGVWLNVISAADDVVRFIGKTGYEWRYRSLIDELEEALGNLQKIDKYDYDRLVGLKAFFPEKFQAKFAELEVRANTLLNKAKQ